MATMREAVGCTAFLVGMAAMYAGAAEPMLRNVAEFDPGLLAEKICQGTFDTGRRRLLAIRPRSEGAFQLRFATDGGVRRSGWPERDRAGDLCDHPAGSHSVQHKRV
jgi:hypothetical protein